MKCPICEAGNLMETYGYEYESEYKGVKFKVPNCCIFICNRCKEGIFDDESNNRIDEEYKRIRNGHNN